jgi:hypothetical protein
MLNFYINRAGKHLDASQRDVLKHAKDELRKTLRPRLKRGGRARIILMNEHPLTRNI